MTVSELVQRLVKAMNVGEVQPDAEVTMADGLPVFVDVVDKDYVVITDVE